MEQQVNTELSDAQKLAMLTKLLDKGNIGISSAIADLVVYGKKKAKNMEAELDIDGIVAKMNIGLDTIASLQRVYLATAKSMASDEALAKTPGLNDIVATLEQSLANLPTREAQVSPYNYEFFCGENGLFNQIHQRHKDGDRFTASTELFPTTNIDFDEVREGYYGIGTQMECLVLTGPDTRRGFVIWRYQGDEPNAFIVTALAEPVNMKSIGRTTLAQLGPILEDIVRPYLDAATH